MDIFASLASICEPMQAPQVPASEQVQYNLPHRNAEMNSNEGYRQPKGGAFTPRKFQHPAEARSFQEGGGRGARGGGRGAGGGGSLEESRRVEDVLSHHLENSPAYPRVPTYQPPKQYHPPSSRMTQSSMPATLDSASLPFPKAKEMNGSYRDMYKEVNASLFTSNYHPPALDRRPPPQIHGDVSRKFEGLNVGSTFGNVGPTFRGGRRNFEDLDTELGRNFGEPSTGGQRGTFGEGNTGAHAMPAGMFDAEQGRRNFGEPSTGGARRNFGERDSGGNAGAYKMSGGLSFPAASDPQSISFGSSSNLIDPQPFQPQAFQPSPSLEPEHAERKSSIPKVLATHPVSNGAANSSSPSHSTNMVAFFLVKADLNSVPPSQRASLPYRTEAALVSGNDPPPSAWVHPELARSLARSRVKADSGFVQTLEDGTQVSVPDEHTYAVGTNQSHRLIRTRLRWPVPITKTEENVLVDGVRAYVRQHQTLPASISELLAYCD